MRSESMRLKAEWATDSEASMLARGIIVLVKSNSWSKISRIKKFKLLKARL